ncbi:hypothetical protein F53441_8390 [Fusarium austroafricanum]|uniref:Uncharacterized protein n=1 Tax=Fusarium austroafricanum TaxID=2364996 RepID=A0A8H4KE54_9HYPO|nr:hypothetical protein F53441_8390 [Fusarium austroafricanum]
MNPFIYSWSPLQDALEDDNFYRLIGSHARWCDACEAPAGNLEELLNMVLLHTDEFPLGDWKAEPLWSYGQSESLFPEHREREAGRLVFETALPLERAQRLGRALTWSRVDDMWYFQDLPDRDMEKLDVPKPTWFHPGALSTASKHNGLRRLVDLPSELIATIQSYCSDAPFWNLVRKIELEIRLDALPCSTTLRRVPLTQIVSWKRGDASPVELLELSLPQYMRVTLDWDGICEIERLTRHPDPSWPSMKRLERMDFVG